MTSRRYAALHARRAAANGPLVVTPRGATLLNLVQEVQREFANDADVVRVIRFLVNSGAVVLTGSFAGRTF